MKKIRLSKLLSEYEEKYSRKDEKYGYYFEESNLEEKVTKLRLFYKILGDISLSEEYFKAILYYGQVEPPREQILWIGELLSKYEDIPEEFLASILFCYSETLFETYPVRETLDYYISKFGMSEKAFKEFFKYLKLKQFILSISVSEQNSQLITLAEEYSVEFAEKIRRLIQEEKLDISKLFELLPSKEFVDKSRVHVVLGYDILSAEDLVIRMLLGYIDFDKFKDDEYIILGLCGDGSLIKTSFTKKEYLEDIQQKKKKQLKIIKKGE